MQLSFLKRCKDCGLEKPVSEFYIKRRATGEVASYCKPCHKLRGKNNPHRKENARKNAKKRYPAHRDELLERSRLYRKLHPEIVRAQWKRAQADGRAAATRERNKKQRTTYNTKWKRENKDKVAQQNKRRAPKVIEWLKAHPEAAKEHRRKYKSTHPEVSKAYAHRRRNRLLAGGSYTPHEWLDLKSKYDHRCLMCHRQEPEIKLTVDHVMPVALKGLNTIENIQPLCKSCNSKKHRKYLDLRT